MLALVLILLLLLAMAAVTNTLYCLLLLVSLTLCLRVRFPNFFQSAVLSSSSVQFIHLLDGLSVDLLPVGCQV